MTPEQYAMDWSKSMNEYAESDPRHLQTLRGQIGASDFSCRQRMAYTIAQKPPTDPENDHGWAAFCGSAMDDKMQAVRAATRPHLWFGVKPLVTLILRSGEPYSFTASPDEVDPINFEVSDYKTKDGLQAIRRGLNDDDQRRQIHLQYLGMVQSHGWPLEGTVRNVFVDRSGKDEHPHIVQEAFDMAVCDEAAERLSDSLYAVEHNERTFQDKERSFCDRYCPQVTRCRGGEIVLFPLKDERAKRLAREYWENHERISNDKEYESELKEMLKGVEGTTGEFNVVWTTRNLKTGPSMALSVTKEK